MATHNQNSDIILPEWTLICTVRYALGRRSYAVSQVCELLDQRWDSLAPDTKEIIQRDIAELFERDDIARCHPLDGFTYPMGMDMDRAEWEKVRTKHFPPKNPPTKYQPSLSRMEYESDMDLDDPEDFNDDEIRQIRKHSDDDEGCP